jgi:hypothetical protein
MTDLDRAPLLGAMRPRKEQSRIRCYDGARLPPRPWTIVGATVRDQFSPPLPLSQPLRIITVALISADESPGRASPSNKAAVPWQQVRIGRRGRRGIQSRGIHIRHAECQHVMPWETEANGERYRAFPILVP